MLLASTSEVYGDPLVHPQPETYWGNVNPVGPRSVYDEAKRFAEAITMAYHREHGVDTRIVRIFNTYGPRMRPDDGRVVSNFVVQALRGEPLTIYGDGSQSRSFCYVSDLVEGIWRLFNADIHEPVNLGNPGEYTIRALSDLVLATTDSASTIEVRPLPDRRSEECALRTSLSPRARLDWTFPGSRSRSGLKRTVEYFQRRLGRPPGRTASGMIAQVGEARPEDGASPGLRGDARIQRGSDARGDRPAREGGGPGGGARRGRRRLGRRVLVDPEPR